MGQFPPWLLVVYAGVAASRMSVDQAGVSVVAPNFVTASLLLRNVWLISS